jgi:site-specific recombinase XerD
MSLDQLVAQFIQQGIYLRNWSPKTVRTYQQSLCRLPIALPLSKDTLNAAVIALRERGLTPGGINIRLRSLNSLLTWAHDEGHLSERLRVKLLRAERKTIMTITDGDVRMLLQFKPQDEGQRRAWTLILTLLDTGLRVEEALSLQRSRVNLEALTLTVLGKGNRERIVPMSSEGRKHLFRLLSKVSGRFVFSTRTEDRLSYRNAYRDIKVVCAAVGIIGRHIHPHAFRHYFAVTYIQRGGDIYKLSRILGHSTITTTQLYLRSMGIEHLQEGHEQFSPLTPMRAR